jgi:hypothetical protein
MFLFLLYNLIYCLSHLSELLLVFHEAAHVILSLNIVHSGGQAHKRDEGVRFQGPLAAGIHEKDHCDAIVDRGWAP